jgi:hypothetical protein
MYAYEHFFIYRNIYAYNEWAFFYIDMHASCMHTMDEHFFHIEMQASRWETLSPVMEAFGLKGPISFFILILLVPVSV